MLHHVHAELPGRIRVHAVGNVAHILKRLANSIRGFRIVVIGIVQVSRQLTNFLLQFLLGHRRPLILLRRIVRATHLRRCNPDSPDERQ